MNNPRFYNPEKEEFYRVLRKKVNAHFKSRGIRKTGDYRVILKATVLFLSLLLPFVFMLILPFKFHSLVFVSLWMLMGWAMAGIGLSVMHESVHGSYSSNRKLNDFTGHIAMFFIGGFVANWRIQHNQLHHTYTNVAELDEDIKPPGDLLRLSPDYPLKKKHRFQHLYAWFLYGLMTVMWCSTKDIKQFARFYRSGFYKNKAAEFKRELTRLILFKVGYFLFFLGLPALFSPYPFWQMFLGFLLMHVVAGFILAIVFQPAHVVPESDFPKVNDQNILENSWAAHQLETTQNFANTNLFLSWYVGGLNYQIEHHLFPNICHIHYPEISSMVRDTAKEYGLPYYHTRSFRGAVWKHAKMLHSLGR